MTETQDLKQILTGRLSIFIDSSNVFFISKKLRVRIDYAKVLEFFRTFDPQAKCYFYTAYQEGYEKQLEYLQTLEQAGLVVRKKPLKFITTPKGKQKLKAFEKVTVNKTTPHEQSFEFTAEDGFFKGNMDVELAIDAIRTMSQYDTFVLFSGDSDFHSLLVYLKEHDKNVVVISYPGFVAEELTDTANFINIGEYLRRGKSKTKPPRKKQHQPKPSLTPKPTPINSGD